MDRHAPLSEERKRLLELRLKRSSAPAGDTRRFPKRSAGQPVPLSSGQHQMWLIDQMTPGNPAYNVPVAYRIRGKLDAPAIGESFNRIISRHESWRTTFRECDDVPAQVIHPECRIRVGITDLTHLPDEDREAAFRAMAADEAIRPFDLSSLPLIRVSLFKLGEDDHALLINVHHIVADGSSLKPLFDELDIAYRAATSGTVPSLPQLDAQFADFALWQNEQLSSSQHAQQLDYWLHRLAGDLPVLDLATDKPRPLRQSFRGSNVGFVIPSQLAHSLGALGHTERCTFFVTIVAAFRVLLMRYSNAGDIVIGTPVASRPLPEFEGLVGNFLNMLAIRGDLSGNPSFVEVLRRSREAVLDALANKDVPFETVVKNLKSHRDPGRNAVFQALIQVLPSVSTRIGELSVSRLEFETRFAQMDLSLHLYEEHDGGYFGQFQFCTDLFAREMIERMSLNFLELLRAIAGAPGQRILDIPIIAEAEKRQLLVEWNRTAAAFPADQSLRTLIAQQTQRTPDSIAVRFGEVQLTYRELEQRTNQLAGTLRSHGIGPDAIVGICIERSLEMVIAVLAVLKAGGAYLPLDPAYPADRLAFMIRDANPPVLLTQERLVASLPPHGAKVICLDRDWADIATASTHAPAAATCDRNLAYVIYTSGSTGRPKGVAMEIGPVTNLIHWQARSAMKKGAFKTLQFASLSFDVAFQEIFTTLTAGGCIVIPPEKIRRDMFELLGFLEREGVERLFLPFVALSHIADAAVSENLFPSRLVEVITAGEQLRITDAMQQFFSRLGNCALHNHYGPTESHVVTSFALHGPPSEWPRLPPIGRPIANARAYILDPDGHPVPIGVPGELCLGGNVLARGYLGQPELTSQRFISDPFDSSPDARIYRTGDRCRYLADGNIEFLGRFDHQVKIRGFRIEPGEIEVTLTQNESIREAAVVLREDAPGERRLTAYVVPTRTPPPSAADLRDYLKARLPDYMMPSAFVFLDALPLNANGKLDRKALPAPGITRGSPEQSFAPPCTEMEKKISAIWREILKVERVGLHDNFFEIGGDSLAAMRVIGRLRGPQFPNLSVFHVFERPTVGDFVKIFSDVDADPAREEGVL